MQNLLFLHTSTPAVFQLLAQMAAMQPLLCVPRYCATKNMAEKHAIAGLAAVHRMAVHLIWVHQLLLHHHQERSREKVREKEAVACQPGGPLMELH